MIQPLSLEFWIGVQFIIDLMIVGLLLIFVKKIKQEQENTKNSRETSDQFGRVNEITAGTAREIVAMLESLTRESTLAAKAFEENIQEKKEVARRLNNAFDSKIISLNLLLTRAESLLGTTQNHRLSVGKPQVDDDPETAVLKEDIVDQQNRILNYHHQGLDEDAIASRLSIPKGEVRLVIGLKKKFAAMDQTG